MRNAISRGTLVVLIMMVGAAAFGTVFGYLQYINNSFPSKIMDFQKFASLKGYSFNGTVFSIYIQWFDKDKYMPLYAQFISDQYASRVYDVATQLHPNGTLLLPFPVEVSLSSMTNVELLIAVKNMTDGTDFTVVYSIGNVNSNRA